MRPAHMEPTIEDLDIPDDVLDAEREVEQRKQEFHDSLRVAGESGSRLAKSVGKQAKPLLIGGAVVLGTAALVGIVVAVSRSRRRNVWLPPARLGSSRTIWSSTLARSAGFWLLRLAAKRFADEVSVRLADPAVPRVASNGNGSAAPR